MEKIAVDDVDVEPHPMGVNTERRPLSDALGTEDVTVVHYRLDPGEQFSGGLHTHHDQEEAFVILEGEATFEHGPRGEASMTVGAGEAIRFAPGEFQCGRNEGDGVVVGLAVAAPGTGHEWDEIESPVPCPDCETVTPHSVRPPEDGFVVYCLQCGAETRVATRVLPGMGRASRATARPAIERHPTAVRTSRRLMSVTLDEDTYPLLWVSDGPIEGF